MPTTYKIQGYLGSYTPFTSFTTPNGVVNAFNQNTSIFDWTPNLNYSGTAVEFIVDVYFDNVFIGATTQTITVPGVCNTAFTFTVVKNNCNTGTPSNQVYSVPANLVCNQSSIFASNWAAYLQSLPIAQAQVNLNGTCSACVAPPCILSKEVGNVIITGVPGYTYKIYNALNVILTGTFPASGVVTLTNSTIVGNIWVTQTNADGAESLKDCNPTPILIKCAPPVEDSCHDCY
jgi:hypothetical protein